MSLGAAPVQVRDEAREYNKQCGMKAGGSSNSDDQTQLLYIMNPDGVFVAAYGREAAALDIARDIANHVEAYRGKHPTWHYPKAVKARMA